MCVHDAIHVRTQPVNQQVHTNFTRHVAPPGYAIPFHVHDNHVGRTHHSLAHGARRNQDPPAVEPNRKIAIRGRYQATLVEHTLVVDDLLAVLAFTAHGMDFRWAAPSSLRYGTARIGHTQSDNEK